MSSTTRANDTFFALSFLIIMTFVVLLITYLLFISECILNINHLSLLLFLLINLGFVFGILFKQKKPNLECFGIFAGILLLNGLIIIEYNQIANMKCEEYLSVSTLTVIFYLSSITFGSLYGTLFMTLNNF